MIHFPDRAEGPFLGSPPAYCSVAAARQGTATGLVTRIGPDMPDALLRPLMEAGVDITGLHRSGRTTLSELHYDVHGNKEICYPAKADAIKAHDVPESFRGCRMIYVCTMDNDVLPADLPAVVACGQTSAVDLGGYGGAHISKAHREELDSPEELACRVSGHFKIVKASDEDAKLIFGSDDPDAAAEKILACGSEVVVITAGPKGAFVYAGKNHWHIPPIPGFVLDTTGGGDTFMAGFLSEYLHTYDPLKSAQWGAATALCVIEKTGGVRLERMPTRDQVQCRIV
jgi:fructokinase